MKLITLILVSFFSIVTFAKPNSDLMKTALESATSCSNFVTFDDNNLYLGFGPYKNFFEEPRNPIPGTLTVIPIQNPTSKLTLRTEDSPIDTLTTNGTLYVLTYTGIEEWDLSSHERLAIYPTMNEAGSPADRQHAQGFALAGDQIVIAHGRLGVTFFDLKTKKITNRILLVQNQAPLESMATGVTVMNGIAYIVMDNYSLVDIGKPAFRGFILVNPKTQTVLRELDGMDPFADSVMSDNSKLIVSFAGSPYWKYSISSLGGMKLPEPMNRVFRFPLNGSPIGRPSMDDKYIYTCFSQPSDVPGGFYKYLPRALDRRVLMLD